MSQRPRLYIEQDLATGATCEVAIGSAHYLARVLRLRVGDGVALFNGRDGEYDGEIQALSRTAARLLVGPQRRPAPLPSALRIHLLLGMSRGDRMALAIRQATELGVEEISPLLTTFSEQAQPPARVATRLKHWRGVAVSAAQQCGRLSLPVLHEPRALTTIPSAADSLDLLLEPSADAGLPLTLPSRVRLAVGPEGGFSPAELDWARERGFRLAQLGPLILRAETAPTAAIAVLQHIHRVALNSG